MVWNHKIAEEKRCLPQFRQLIDDDWQGFIIIIILVFSAFPLTHRYNLF